MANIHMSAVKVILEGQEGEFKLRKTGSIRRNLDIRKNFFSQRVIDSWNALPSKIVRSETFAEFKHKFYNFLNENKNFLRKYKSSRKQYIN